MVLGVKKPHEKHVQFSVEFFPRFKIEFQYSFEENRDLFTTCLRILNSYSHERGTNQNYDESRSRPRVMNLVDSDS